MKKFIFTLTAMLTMALSTNAMSYEQAREQALFLTDKMAYELNLNDAQYEAAYEINLDYLMSIATRDDLYGEYWRRRNLDLSYILFDWQYEVYCAANYFYRPIYWRAGNWHFGIYVRYPHRNYYYFGRPTFYATYRGGHNWHSNGGRSWYHGRNYGHYNKDKHFGMRDGFNRGDYGRPKHYNDRMDKKDYNRYDKGNRDYRNNPSREDHHKGNFSGYRGSSTRLTATQPNTSSATSSDRSSDHSNRSFGSSNHSFGSSNRSFGSSSSSSNSHSGFSSRSSSSRPSMGSSNSGSSHSSSRGFGGRR